MKLNERNGVVGVVELIKNGVSVQEHNMVLSAGLNWIAQRLVGGGQRASHIAVGSGTKPAAPSDTALAAEVTRKALAVQGGTVSGNSVVFEVSFLESEAVGALTEAMLTDAASGGTAIARVVFGVINKADGDLFAVRWTLTVNFG